MKLTGVEHDGEQACLEAGDGADFLCGLAERAEEGGNGGAEEVGDGYEDKVGDGYEEKRGNSGTSFFSVQLLSTRPDRGPLRLGRLD